VTRHSKSSVSTALVVTVNALHGAHDNGSFEEHAVQDHCVYMLAQSASRDARLSTLDVHIAMWKCKEVLVLAHSL
jgi:hypothetical protein